VEKPTFMLWRALVTVADSYDGGSCFEFAQLEAERSRVMATSACKHPQHLLGVTCLNCGLIQLSPTQIEMHRIRRPNINGDNGDNDGPGADGALSSYHQLLSGGGGGGGSVAAAGSEGNKLFASSLVTGVRKVASFYKCAPYHFVSRIIIIHLSVIFIF